MLTGLVGERVGREVKLCDVRRQCSEVLDQLGLRGRRHLAPRRCPWKSEVVWKRVSVVSPFIRHYWLVSQTCAWNGTDVKGVVGLPVHLSGRRW